MTEQAEKLTISVGGYEILAKIHKNQKDGTEVAVAASAKIHETAYIHPMARICGGVTVKENAVIHESTIIHAGSVIGKGSVIGINHLKQGVVPASESDNPFIRELVVQPRISIETLTGGAVDTLGTDDVDTLLFYTVVGYESIIGDNTTVETGVQIGEESVIGNNVTIEHNTIIGGDAEIEPHVVIAQNTIIGSDVYIGERSKIGRSRNLGIKVRIEDDCAIHEDCTILCDFLGEGTILMENCNLSPGAIVGRGVKLLERISVGKNAAIGTQARIGQNVGDGETVAALTSYPPGDWKHPFDH